MLKRLDYVCITSKMSSFTIDLSVGRQIEKIFSSIWKKKIYLADPVDWATPIDSEKFPAPKVPPCMDPLVKMHAYLDA